MNPPLGRDPLCWGSRKLGHHAYQCRKNIPARTQRTDIVSIVDDGILDAADIVGEPNKYAVRDLRLGPNTDGLSLDNNIIMRNRQWHFSEMDMDHEENDHEQTTEEQMYNTQQITSGFEISAGNAPQLNIVGHVESPSRYMPN